MNFDEAVNAALGSKSPAVGQAYALVALALAVKELAQKMPTPQTSP